MRGFNILKNLTLHEPKKRRRNCGATLLPWGLLSLRNHSTNLKYIRVSRVERGDHPRSEMSRGCHFESGLSRAVGVSCTGKN